MNNKIYELSEDEFISLIRNKVWLGSYWKVITPENYKEF